MDAGSGADPLIEALIKAGFDVTGVYTSAALLEIAHENIPGARFLHASIYDIEIRGYDAVVALGEPLTYHTQGDDANNLISTFFQRAADALPAGGMLIFDVIGLGQPSLAGRTWSTSDDWAVLVETTEDQTEKILVRNIEAFRCFGEVYRRTRETHTVRLFDIDTIYNQLAS